MKTLNLNYIVLFAVVFLVGMFIYGEIAARRECKREIREIRELQDRTLSLVDSANANYAKKKLEFLETNKKLYRQLDSILDLRVAHSQKTNQTAPPAKKESINLESDILDLNELLKDQ